jgi:hypothetical protein
VFTPSDTNYLAATKTVNLVVNKAVLRVAADNQTIAFGGSLAPFTASITGFVNGDAPSVVTGAASLSTIPATPTAAGTYPITAAQGTLAAANYSFTFVPGHPHYHQDKSHHFLGEPGRLHLRNCPLQHPVECHRVGPRHPHLYSGVRQYSSRRYRYFFSHLQADGH